MYVILLETREEPVLETHRTETVQIDTAPIQETVQTTKKVIKKKKKTVKVTEETQEASRESEQVGALPEALAEEVLEQIEIAPTKPFSATVSEEPTLSTHITETVQIFTEPAPMPEQIAAEPETAPQEVVQPIEIVATEPTRAEVRQEPVLETHTTEVVQIDTAPVQETVQITKKVIKKEKRTKVQATEVVEEQAAVPEQASVIPESLPEEIVEPAPIVPIEPLIAEPREEPALETHKTEIVHIDEAPVSESVTIQRTKKVIKKKKRADVQVTEVSEEEETRAPDQVTAITETLPEEELQIQTIAPTEPIRAEVHQEPLWETHETQIVQVDTEQTRPVPALEEATPLPLTTFEDTPQSLDTALVEPTLAELTEEPRMEVHRTETVEIITDMTELPEQVTHITEVLQEESSEPLSIAPVEPATVTIHEQPELETTSTEIIQIDTAPVQDVHIQKTKKIIKKKKRTEDVQVTDISEDIIPVVEQASAVPETVSMEVVEPIIIAPAEPIAAQISEEPQMATSRTETVHISTEIQPVPEQVSALPELQPEELVEQAEIAPVEQITAEFRHEPQMLTHRTETVTIETAPVQETTFKTKTVKKIIKKKTKQTSEATEATLTAQTATDVIEETPEDSFEVLHIAAPERERIESREFDYETHKAKVTRVTTEECVPGFKALLHIAKDTKVYMDTVEAEELQTPQLQQDLARLNIEVKRGAQVQELMTMLKEGDFPALQAPEHQASIVDVASRLEKATVTQVLVKEAAEKSEMNIGAKTLLRTIERGQETIEDVIMDVSREFGPKSLPAQEVAAVGHLLKEGVRCDEVVTMIEAGLLPGLQNPETQLPIVSMVSNKGHTGVVCEVLVEESTKELQPFSSKATSAAVSEYKQLLVKAKESSADVKTLSKEMAPGVKAYVEMAEAEKVVIEEIVEKSNVETEIKKDMHKVGQMVKQGVSTDEVLNLFEAGEFPALRKVEAQAQLLNVVEESGFSAIVNKVTIGEAMQKSEKAIGAKAFVKMMEEAKVDIQEIISETLPKEFGPEDQKPLEEVQKVSLMIKEGVQAEEIIDMMEANQLPALKKPESQAPLLKVVEQQGQRALVCQVLIEESVKDIKQGLPKVDMASVSSVQSSLTTASASEIVVRVTAAVRVWLRSSLSDCSWLDVRTHLPTQASSYPIGPTSPLLSPPLFCHCVFVDTYCAAPFTDLASIVCKWITINKR
ncbi:hypothetical protein FHG87_007955 [Trinorchestia longiramus]|nr:hypothetical protein FHG87_007955 [Trinorchestia longiramus]